MKAITEMWEVIKTIYRYITHPMEFIKDFATMICDMSFEVCLFLCFLGIVLYLIGVEKGAKLAKISFFAFLAIQIFRWVATS